MPQQLNNSGGTWSEYINPSGFVNQGRSVDSDGLMNALGTFATSRLLTLIAPWKVLVGAPVIKALIRASESKMFVRGGYGEKWHQDFIGNVWPYFAEKEIADWVKEAPDNHTSDLRQVSVLRDIFDTEVNDRTTWLRLFEIYVSLFRVSYPRPVEEAMELIKQLRPNNMPIPETFFGSSKVLLNRGSVNKDNTLVISRVLETDACQTLEELAKGLFSRRKGNVEFILQAPEELENLAYQESLTLKDAILKSPDLNKSITSDIKDFTTDEKQVELRHVRLQYGTWIGLFAFRKIFPNFLIATLDEPMSVRGNIVSETGTDAVKDATFIRMPAGSIGLQGLGMWLKPRVGDYTRKKLYEEAHPRSNLKEIYDEDILSVLIEKENKICGILKERWQKASDKKIPDALSPKLLDYYNRYQVALKTTRADDVRWLSDLTRILGDCQSAVKKDLKDLNQESKGILW